MKIKKHGVEFEAVQLTGFGPVDAPFYKKIALIYGNPIDLDNCDQDFSIPRLAFSSKSGKTYLYAPTVLDTALVERATRNRLRPGKWIVWDESNNVYCLSNKSFQKQLENVETVSYSINNYEAKAGASVIDTNVDAIRLCDSNILEVLKMFENETLSINAYTVNSREHFLSIELYDADLSTTFDVQILFGNWLARANQAFCVFTNSDFNNKYQLVAVDS